MYVLRLFGFLVGSNAAVTITIDMLGSTLRLRIVSLSGQTDTEGWVEGGMDLVIS